MLSSLFPVALLLSTVAEATITKNVRTSKPFRAASADVVSPHYFELAKKTVKSPRGYNPRSAAFALASGNTTASTGLISLYEGEEFATGITIGGQSFQVIVDTGSSDTWVVESDFLCVDVSTEEPLNQTDCGFGPAYISTSTFHQIPDVNFNITYGDGEFLSGIFGYENTTLAGLTVNQTIAVVDYAAWFGDTVTSGLLGLAYPALTSEYAGTNPKNDTVQIPYSPIFTTLYTEGLIAPVFSLVIERDISGPAGYLTLGGLPPVEFDATFTSTPILITEIRGYPKALDFYTIVLDGVVLGNATISTGSTQYIVDSGTTLNYLPTPIADAINAAFVPPAVFSNDYGAYLVDCNATAPPFGIKINGTTFWTNPLDMILGFTDSDGSITCITGIEDGGVDVPGRSLFILGDTFMKNVVSVFDVGAGELRFAAREFYESNDPYKKVKKD